MANLPVAIVAEDHAVFRAALAQLIEGEIKCAVVHEVASLESLMDCVDRTPGAALISVDLSMPGMDGVQSLQTLRRRLPAARIVIVSASARREDILAALEIGVDGYIPKTMEIDDVRRALRMIVDGNIFIPHLSLDRTLTQQRRSSDRAADREHGLTDRQVDVLAMLREGCSNKQIARRLGLAEGTVKAHVNAIYRVLGVTNRVAAAAHPFRR